MSEKVQRYVLGGTTSRSHQMLERDSGNWVRYSDYTKLEAENERLKKALDLANRIVCYVPESEEEEIDWYVEWNEAWAAAIQETE